MAARRRTTQDRRQRFTDQRARDLIIRTDPTIPAIRGPHLTRLLTTDDPVRYYQLLRLQHAAPDNDTFLSALAVEADFLRSTGAPSLAEAEDTHLAAYITAVSDPGSQLLRRTCLISCTLALADIGQDDVERPQGLVPPPQLIHLSEKTSHGRLTKGQPAAAQQRAATNDEILAIRLAVPLTPHEHPTAVGTNVAIANSGATQAEVPQVKVKNISDTHQAIKLPGRHTHDSESPHYLPARWVNLDAWSHQQVQNAREQLLHTPSASLGYRGAQEITTQAARTYCGKAVNAAISVAGLDGVWGLAIGSLSLWRLAYTVLADGMDATAKRYGAQTPRTIEKLIRQQHDAAG